MKKILLIEDDPSVCAIIKKGLEEDKFFIDEAHDGEKGVEMFEKGTYDLIILDIMLPKLNGLGVCEKIRHKSNIPILLLTALGTAENVALGLNKGADDYLVKPFKFVELIARINSLIRRSSIALADSASTIFKYSVIEINDNTKNVIVNDKEVNLTTTEYNLLLLFLKTPRKVFSRQEILEAVWGINFDLGTNVVDVYINYLRRKLEKQNCPKLIQTVVGMGYVMRE